MYISNQNKITFIYPYSKSLEVYTLQLKVQLRPEIQRLMI